MGYRCIQCGCPVKTLYVQYSPGNIRLMKCENCKAVADEYIECEIMILAIDLILHKPKAYRHLLHNVINQETMKFQMFDLGKQQGKIGFINECLSISINMLEGADGCFIWELDVSFNFLLYGYDAFPCINHHHQLVTTAVYSCTDSCQCIDLLLALMISSYFKIFFIAMMVWEFPSSVIFIIELFCLSSNAATLKVMTDSTMSRCVWTCFSAYAIKFIITWILELLPGQLMQGWSQMPFTFYKPA
ncbi:Protein arv1 [Glycine max]|nr:Protein arv1 [Glycine max]